MKREREFVGLYPLRRGRERGSRERAEALDIFVAERPGNCVKASFQISITDRRGVLLWRRSSLSLVIPLSPLLQPRSHLLRHPLSRRSPVTKPSRHYVFALQGSDNRFVDTSPSNGLSPAVFESLLLCSRLGLPAVLALSVAHLS